MDQPAENEPQTTREWIREYGLGLGLGGVLMLYGLIALAVGRTFLPGLHGNDHTIGGASGQALAGSYLIGGAYLFIRLFLEDRTGSEAARALLYALECLLLVGLIGSLIYVLLHVGEVM